MQQIIIDWGSTNFRACLLSEQGELIAQKSTDRGVFSFDGEGFEEYLTQQCGEWFNDDAFGQGKVIMSGMIGSRNGWLETDYLRCPVNANTLARAVVSVPNALGLDISLVPGVSYHASQNSADVMRGEETQIIGVMAQLGIKEGAKDGLICLPGTHSKWVTVSDRSITALSTFMTGELFSLLSEQSSLASLCSDSTFNQAAFTAGLVHAQQNGCLLNQLFTVRAKCLTGLLQPNQSHAFLSGLLIGSEFVEATRSFVGSELILVGNQALLSHYALAARHFGLDCTPLDATKMTIAGLIGISSLESAFNKEKIAC
ncbi:MAG: 2-dehydro-3-deoxygalactonokinase [Algicola sp.]|nr:2-dehydro-3-deoxygalactonokinase [Algicola sp.]